MTYYKSILLSLFVLFFGFTVMADDEIEYPAYYKVCTLSGGMNDAIASVEAALTSSGFEIVGAYNPAGDPNFRVICYTRKDLADLCLKFEDRGALASVMKIGLKNNSGNIDVSMINPEYIFYAYLLEDIDPYLARLQGISNDAKTAMKQVGKDFIPFGGFQTREDLEDYHYKIMMPYFTDPEDLAEYESFEEGLSVIRANLEAKKGNTYKVYEVVYPDQKVAVFGIGLLDAEEGEADFLPTIGDDHIAALPYEIILQGTEVTMLPGRYRLALHWPELSMGTFMKIMSTPGNIEDFMEGVTEK